MNLRSAEIKSVAGTAFFRGGWGECLLPVGVTPTEHKNRDVQFAPKVQSGGCRPATTVMNARCESWRICDYGKLIEFFLFGTPKPEVAAFEDRWHRVADGQRGGRGAARGNGGR